MNILGNFNYWLGKSECSQLKKLLKVINNNLGTITNRCAVFVIKLSNSCKTVFKSFAISMEMVFSVFYWVYHLLSYESTTGQVVACGKSQIDQNATLRTFYLPSCGS